MTLPSLPQPFMFPTPELQGAPTGHHLYSSTPTLAVQAVQLLPTTAEYVPNDADEIIERESYPTAAGFEQERMMWVTLAELREVFERDRVLIEITDAIRRAAKTAHAQVD